MMVVTLKRSNSHLNGMRWRFYDSKKAADWIEIQAAALEEEDWELTQDEKSDSENGLIIAVHAFENYKLFLSWRTLHS